MTKGSRVSHCRSALWTEGAILGTVEAVFDVYEDKLSNAMDPGIFVKWDDGRTLVHDRVELIEVSE